MRTVKNNHMETTLMRLIGEVRSQNMTLTEANLQEKGCFFADVLNI